MCFSVSSILFYRSKGYMGGGLFCGQHRRDVHILYDQNTLTFGIRWLELNAFSTGGRV